MSHGRSERGCVQAGSLLYLVGWIVWLKGESGGVENEMSFRGFLILIWVALSLSLRGQELELMKWSGALNVPDPVAVSADPLTPRHRSPF